MKPLLGLVMIVRNEATGIAETLGSVADFVDMVTILDTGSTDGTREVILDTLQRRALTLHCEPFVDFATTRNRVLELHGDQTVFTLMLSGDDILLDGEALRSFLSSQRDELTETCYVERRTGSTRYPQAMVMRTGTGWRYVGRTHEVLVKPDCATTVTAPGAVIRRRGDTDKRQRWEQDRRILEEDLRVNPYDARAVFYYAQTLECLGDRTGALNAYRRRIGLGGWAPEVYEAWFRVARCTSGTWNEIQAAYLDAYAFDPTRAEPLCAIAEHWYFEKNLALTHLFARRAALLPIPTTSLFVDHDVYTWRAADLAAVAAFHLGPQLNDREMWDEGERLAEKAAFAVPDDARLQKNLRLYREA